MSGPTNKNSVEVRIDGFTYKITISLRKDIDSLLQPFSATKSAVSTGVVKKVAKPTSKELFAQAKVVAAEEKKAKADAKKADKNK